MAVKQQVVLDVSGSSDRSGNLLLLLFLLLLVVSGETHLEVVEDAAGHKALQILPGKWRNNTESHSRFVKFPARLFLRS